MLKFSINRTVESSIADVPLRVADAVQAVTERSIDTNEISVRSNRGVSPMRCPIAGLFLLAAVFGDPAEAEILIGVAGPMTGPLSWIGEQSQRGSEMAVADINKAGGVLGQQVTLITADDFCNPEQAVAVAQKFVGDGVMLVVGHMCSESSIPASKVYAKAGIVLISPASTNPLLTEQGYPDVFRVIGRDDAQGVVAGNYLADHWADAKIAILNDGTTYGTGLAQETKAQLNKRNVKEAIFAAYSPDQDDYSAEIDMLQAAGIGVLYVGGRHRAVAIMARTALDRGFKLQVSPGTPRPLRNSVSSPVLQPKARFLPSVLTRAEMLTQHNSSSASALSPLNLPAIHCSAMQLCKPGRRLPKKLASSSRQRSFNHCTATSSTRFWGGSALMPRAISPFKIGCGKSGAAVSMFRWNEAA